MTNTAQTPMQTNFHKRVCAFCDRPTGHTILATMTINRGGTSHSVPCCARCEGTALPYVRDDKQTPQGLRMGYTVKEFV